MSHTTLEQMLEALEELAPGSRLYFCLLLAGKNPVDFLASSQNPDLRELVVSATPAEKAEILNTIANWVVNSKDEPIKNKVELELAG